LDDEIYVVMAGELPPDHILEFQDKRSEELVNDPDSALVSKGPPSPARDTHIVGDDIPVDGWVTFYDPEKLHALEPFKHGTFPFRSVEKDDAPWFGRPDADKWHRSPIWKWQNPDEDPHERLTLNPSIGRQDEDGITFHCYIRNGEIDWL
jgi:hypothetical protein